MIRDRDPKPLTVIRTTRERPKTTSYGTPIPADWVIFNAPRPLSGSVLEEPGGAYGFLSWTGDWLRGVHFAAVNPRDPELRATLEINIDQDGWAVEWGVTDEAVRKEYRAHVESEGYSWEWANSNLSAEEIQKEATRHFLDNARRTVDAAQYFGELLLRPQAEPNITI